MIYEPIVSDQSKVTPISQASAVYKQVLML